MPLKLLSPLPNCDYTIPTSLQNIRVIGICTDVKCQKVDMSMIFWSGMADLTHELMNNLDNMIQRSKYQLSWFFIIILYQKYKIFKIVILILNNRLNIHTSDKLKLCNQKLREKTVKSYLLWEFPHIKD